MRPTIHVLTMVLCAAGAAPAAEARAQVADSSGGAVASPLATRPADELRRASLRYAPTVRSCYEREGLAQDPTLRGKLEIGFTIFGDGAVREISVDTLEVHGVGMRDVVRCVAQAAGGWHFTAGAYATDAVLLAFDLLPQAPDTRPAPGHTAPASAGPAPTDPARPAGQPARPRR